MPKPSAARVAAIKDKLNRLVAATEAADLDRPHLVISYDPVTDGRQYFGPFLNAADALAVRDRAKQNWHDLDPHSLAGPAPTFSTAPMHSPTSLHGGEDNG